MVLVCLAVESCTERPVSEPQCILPLSVGHRVVAILHPVLSSQNIHGRFGRCVLLNPTFVCAAADLLIVILYSPLEDINHLGRLGRFFRSSDRTVYPCVCVVMGTGGDLDAVGRLLLVVHVPLLLGSSAYSAAIVGSLDTLVYHKITVVVWIGLGCVDATVVVVLVVREGKVQINRRRTIMNGMAEVVLLL